MQYSSSESSFSFFRPICNIFQKIDHFVLSCVGVLIRKGFIFSLLLLAYAYKTTLP